MLAFNESESRRARHDRLIRQATSSNAQQSQQQYVQQQGPKSDFQLLREGHQFLRSDNNLNNNIDNNNGLNEQSGPVSDAQTQQSIRLARRYYDRLFKEYVIGDLQMYKQNRFGFRWRTENEVIVGKGQFICGNKRCDNGEVVKGIEQKESKQTERFQDDLVRGPKAGRESDNDLSNKLLSYQVHFCYKDHHNSNSHNDKISNSNTLNTNSKSLNSSTGTKEALVKIRLCPECAFKLKYTHLKGKMKEEKKLQKKIKKEERKLAKLKRKRRKLDNKLGNHNKSQTSRRHISESDSEKAEEGNDHNDNDSSHSNSDNSEEESQSNQNLNQFISLDDPSSLSTATRRELERLAWTRNGAMKDSAAARTKQDSDDMDDYFEDLFE